jgi:hypothetical protein
VNSKILLSPKVVLEIASRFELMAPFVEFLNQPFAHKARKKTMAFFAF